MYTYLLPQKVPTNATGYGALIECGETLLSTEDTAYTIDFRNCDWIDPNLSSVLGAYLDILVDRGCSVVLQDMNEQIKERLSRNGFILKYDRTAREMEKENFIPFERFRVDNDLYFKQYVDEWLIQKQSFPKHTQLVGEKILETIYEIYANAIGHGGTNLVYSCGEILSGNQLNMTIVDLGNTIPGNVNAYLEEKGEPKKTPCECIQWAMVEGNTTKRKAGGLGLALLQDFIRQNEGSMDIVSGQALLTMKGEKINTYHLERPFRGTIVNMEFNFEDSKNYMMASEVNLHDLL